MNNKIRMLLSYNFAITETNISPLARPEFAEFFSSKLTEKDAKIECRTLNNPHWILEIIFPKTEFFPEQIGEICAEYLAGKRQNESQEAGKIHDILALGGIKKTPSSSSSPDSLKTGEWGVDLVETSSAQIFLEAMAWEAKTAGKNSDSIFKIEI